ncbi:ATP-binding protein [Nocardioides sp. CFH 31398]|uniref:ATP-binding protein n=1 Tax=Nocardioides sp. CFH 31398 TaxID=2919579 RepID=UPI001F050C00|nr:ATP-binding protein [Nocardioides sp. CFH 31398]MCH1869035.1 ATP-binding protein [Nocardioides sp. CFH 31398]
MTHPELYRHVVESSADGLWVLDAEGRTVFANQRLADMLRTDRADLMGRDHAEFLDEQGRAQWAARLARHDPPTDPVECRFLRGDGTGAWFLVSQAHLPVTADGDEGSTILMSLSDFDDRRRLEAELEANRQELLEAHRVAGLGSWSVDLRSDTLTFSTTLLELVRQPAAAATRSWRDTVAGLKPETRDALNGAVAALESGRDDQRTLDISSRSEEPERWLRVRLVAHREDDVLVGLSGTVQDVTEIHSTEDALHDLVRQNELMRGVAVAANASQTLGEALTACGPLVVRHDRWRRARTFDPDDALTEWSLSFGTDVEPSDPDLDDRERRTARRALTASGPVWDDETGLTVACAVAAGGRPAAVIVMTSDPPLTDRDAITDMLTRVVAQLASVAERESTAAELAAARDEAMEASRQKSEFLATMSHEIRTPLNGVIGLNDLLRTTSLDEHQERLVHGVGSSGRALLGLVDDILDFSKIEAGQLVLETIDVDLRAVLDDVAAMVAETARARRVEVVMHCDRSVPGLVRSDRVRLTQVVSNLVSNAVKFTEDGEVTVSIRPEPATATEPPALRLEVTDTGVGIDPGRVSTIFEPFIQADATTTRRYGGTGLGLAIVREIVAALGGEIGVTSEPGAGSTFWCRLPVVPTPGQHGVVADLAGRRAVVVDTHPARGRALVERLAHWGVGATWTDTATDAAAGVDAVLLGPRTVAGHADLGAAVVRLVDPDEPDAAAQRAAQQAAQETSEHTVEVPVTSERLQLALVAAVHGHRPSGHDAGAVPADGAGERRPGTTTGATGPAGQRRRILVVEDTPVNQLVAEGMLAALGYDAESVDDGVSALERLERSPGFDLVLLDVQMPRMDGYATVRAIREREARTGAPRMPVVAMTAAAVTGERERCLEAGMDDFLTKPVSPPHLATALTDHLPTRPAAAGVPAAPGSGSSPVPPSSATPPAAATGEPEQPTSPGVPDDLLEHLDLERLDMLRDLDPGNTAYVDRVIGNFVRRTPELLGRISDAVDADDTETVAATAHRLRGSALNLGVPRVAETALGLELAGEGEDLAPAPGLVEELADRLEHGRAAVLAYRRSYGGDDQA